MSPFFKSKNVLIPLAAVMGLLPACSGAAGNLVGGPASQAQQVAATSTAVPTAAAAAPPTYLVQRGDVQDILEFSGRWEPRDQVALSFQVGGTVRRVNVQRGDTVSAGELLADFQIDDLENQLASAQLSLQTALSSLQTGEQGGVQSVQDAQISLANAQLSLDNARAGSPWPQLESARLQVEKAQQDVYNAERDYNNARSHPENPSSTIDQAYQALQSARDSLQSAQASYDSAAQSFNTHQFSVSQAENGVTQAQLALERARDNAGSGTDAQSVQTAQLQIDQIQGNIARSSLYSPIDGVVLSVSIKPGDAVQAYTAVITIGQPEPKEADADLALSDARQLSVGMIGICEILNHPETAVQCVVRQIPITAQDADQTTHIAASLDNVAVGQLIDVQMPLQVSHNVLWLPPAAIRTFQSRTFVVVQTPDGQRVTDVTLGLQTTDRDEITAGVNEGDIVVGP